MRNDSGSGSPALVICSKSTWEPTIRREHALAQLATAHGAEVYFVERPADVRASGRRGEALGWCRGFAARYARRSVQDGVEVLGASVILPGHRGGLGERSSAWLLARKLRGIPRLNEAVVVANLPWQWPAVAAVDARRRVFDCTDDWAEHLPERAGRLAELCSRIGREADAITLDNRAMADRFRPGRTVLVRNGVSAELLGPLAERPQEKRMVHTGTLGLRFDADLAGEVLAAASDWRLDLYGQCQYPGRGERAGAELEELLARYPSRVAYHGVVPRAGLAQVIDRGSVAVIFNRPGRAGGGDSMKLYDYAARGRPIVSTRFSPNLQVDGPPRLRLADNTAEFVAALEESLFEPLSWAGERRRWAEDQRWEQRWPTWARTLFG